MNKIKYLSKNNTKLYQIGHTQSQKNWENVVEYQSIQIVAGDESRDSEINLKISLFILFIQ